MKKRTANHVHYYWWAYLVLIVAVVGIWSVVFSAMARPAYDEQVTVDFFGQNCDVKGLEAHLQQALPPLCSQEIKKVDVNSSGAVKDTAFYQKLQARNYAADIFVFTEDFAADSFFPSLFIPLNEALLRQHLGEVSFYYEDGKAYGIILNPEGAQNTFTRYYTGDQLCIAAFASESVNVAGLFGKGKAGDDAALVALKYLLTEVP